MMRDEDLSRLGIKGNNPNKVVEAAGNTDKVNHSANSQEDKTDQSMEGKTNERLV